MLEVSSSATDLIGQMIDNVRGIEGIRAASASSESFKGTAPHVGVVIDAAAGPLAEDHALVEGGIAVFVDLEIAPVLDDKVLDLIPSGVDQVRFTLAERS